MTHNNFEKQARELLDKREIQPSQRAWNEISAALEEQQGSPKSNYFWYGIAAGFAGVLLISILYYTTTVPETGSSEIVATPLDGNAVEATELPAQQEVLIPEAIKEISISVARAESNATPIAAPPKSEKSGALIAVLPATDKPSDPKVIPVQAEEIINSKLVEVLARVKLLENDENTLTTAEVDALLREAQQEILTDRLFREDKTVDATALLNEVEDELDQSFRDQIFEKLKTGFIKVRTAVADRNN